MQPVYQHNVQQQYVANRYPYSLQNRNNQTTHLYHVSTNPNQSSASPSQYLSRISQNNSYLFLSARSSSNQPTPSHAPAIGSLNTMHAAKSPSYVLRNASKSSYVVTTSAESSLQTADSSSKTSEDPPQKLSNIRSEDVMWENGIKTPCFPRGSTTELLQPCERTKITMFILLQQKLLTKNSYKD
eukprot:GHVL01031540.1.p1 GENE.GHVL01031540.1~~GHVL01031540.1.p1  ORF type:complete len:197 (+),score=8.93 GHVL01031540.1:37-591(+)